MKYLFLIISVFSVAFAKAQTITFELNAPDTAIYMARYLGNKQYYCDTANLVNNKVTFDASKHKAGLYMLLMPNGKAFDFIIDDKEVVKMKIGDMDAPSETMTVEKSVNNKIFYDYMNYMRAKRLEGQKIGEKMKVDSLVEGEKEVYQTELKKINQDVINFQKAMVANYPQLFIGLMVHMSMDIELPEHPRDAEGNITDSNFVYHYYVNHYWDNVNLKDPRTVNTPVFHNKLDRYFSSKGVLQIPDTIAVYASRLVEETNMVDQENKVFQYVLHHITNKYETSPIMGMDKVFCYMATRYYCPPNNYAYWMTEENTKKVCERAEKVCRNSPGVASVPLILPDTTEKKWYGTYDITADYTILYFWDPNCGHCKKVTPKLQTLYEKKFKERNVEVYAVGKGIGEEFEQWKKFIRDNKLTFINVGLTDSIYNLAMEADQKGLQLLLSKYTTVQSLNYADTYDVYSTPRIYILDKDKVILYKQISIGQLEEIIDKLTGHASDPKLFPLSDASNGDNPPDDEEETH